MMKLQFNHKCVKFSIISCCLPITTLFELPAILIMAPNTDVFACPPHSPFSMEKRGPDGKKAGPEKIT